MLAISVYRARHACLTFDEALSYKFYLRNPFHNLFDYDANNHVLFTLISYATVSVLGHSPMAIRLPALVAGALYLALIVLISRRLFRGFWLPLCVGLLALNPIILDYLSLARGYGLALALFLLALVLAVDWVDILYDPLPAGDDNQPRSAWISVAAALSVCANLTFAVPCAALFCVLFFLQLVNRTRSVSYKPVLIRLVVPGAMVGIALLWPFIPQFRQTKFYVGETSFLDSVITIASSSLLYKQTAIVGLGHPLLSSQSVLAEKIAAAVIVILLFCILVQLLPILHRLISGRSLARSQTRFALVAGSLLGSFILQIALCGFASFKFPESRTGMYFTPLLTLSVALWATFSADSPGGSIRRWFLSTLAVATLVIYLLQLQVSSYHYARYDADDQTALQVIRDDVSKIRVTEAGKPAVRIGGTWLHEPTINFYRECLHDDSIQPFERVDHPLPADYDYFVFHPTDCEDLDDRQLHVLFVGPISGTVVARVVHPATRPAGQ